MWLCPQCHPACQNSKQSPQWGRPGTWMKHHSRVMFNFWTTVCKTIRPMLSDRCVVYSCPVCLSVCLSVCHVCNVGVLCPNGWTNQGEIWHTGRTRPWPHCVRWGPNSPSPKGHRPQFSASYCGQVAGWIKLPHGRKVGFDSSNIVFDRDPAPFL